MNHLNLSEQLMHDIGRQIIHGRLKPGDVLPKVENLSFMKGVSRTVVREALKGLVARRLVESSTKVGTVVLPRSEWQWFDRDVLTWASEDKNNKEFLLKLTEIRLAIEPAAVELAAVNATEAEIERIKAAYRAYEAAIDDDEEWAKADYELHNSILVASHNELMISAVNTLRAPLVASRLVTIPHLKERAARSRDKNVYEEVLLHKEVCDAVCARDKERARQKMHELIQRVAKLL